MRRSKWGTRPRAFWSTVCVATTLAVCVAAVEASEAQEPGTVSVTEFFKGKVVKLTKKGEIEIHYDFEDAAQLGDFEESLPYRAIRSATQTLERGQLRMKGTGSFRHKAIFGERIESKEIGRAHV